MSTDFYIFWQSDTLINFLQYEVSRPYCPPRLLCVPTLPWRICIVKCPRVQQLIVVLFQQTFFVLKPNFDISCRNTPEENVKNIRYSLASYLLLSSSTL